MAVDERVDGAGATGDLLDDHAPHRPRCELRCVNCGYGAVAALPIRCPMCGGDVWDFVDWRPFAR